ncbi:unnamed protein product, partial [Citrullus colocynthis]
VEPEVVLSVAFSNEVGMVEINQLKVEDDRWLKRKRETRKTKEELTKICENSL